MNHIRIGPNETVRTSELSEYFSEITGQKTSHTCKFPRLMKKFMIDHPNLSITKKVRNYGTIYIGLGLAPLPQAKFKRPALIMKNASDRRLARNYFLLDNIRDAICQKTGWSIIQYQQMVNLGLVYVIRDDNVTNVDAMIIVSKARILLYVNEVKNKLMRKSVLANIAVNNSMRAAVEDKILTKKNSMYMYTNRLLIAEKTYIAGYQLEVMIQSYVNKTADLPQIEHFTYPNIQNLSITAVWLKDNSMYHRI